MSFLSMTAGDVCQRGSLWLQQRNAKTIPSGCRLGIGREQNAATYWLLSGCGVLLACAAVSNSTAASIDTLNLINLMMQKNNAWHRFVWRARFAGEGS